MTVTVCGESAFAGVKTREAGDTDPSVESLEDRPMVTSAVGTELRATVKVAMPPPSVVVRPEVGVTVMPAAPTQQAGTAVWMFRRHPPLMLPENPVKSSRTKRLHVPLGLVPWKAASTVA